MFFPERLLVLTSHSGARESVALVSSSGRCCESEHASIVPSLPHPVAGPSVEFLTMVDLPSFQAQNSLINS